MCFPTTGSSIQKTDSSRNVHQGQGCLDQYGSTVHVDDIPKREFTHLPFLEVAASGSALSLGPPGRRAENSVGMGALDSSSVSSSAGEVLALPADLPLRPGPRSSEQALARRGRAGQLVTSVLFGGGRCGGGVAIYSPSLISSSGVSVRHVPAKIFLPLC